MVVIRLSGVSTYIVVVVVVVVVVGWYTKWNILGRKLMIDWMWHCWELSSTTTEDNVPATWLHFMSSCETQFSSIEYHPNY
jgi:hypothetical protein